MEKISRVWRSVYILRPLPLRIRVLILLNLCLMTYYYSLTANTPLTSQPTTGVEVTDSPPKVIVKRDYINTHHTFDPDQKDVLVFLHIQKTGGTMFEKLLTDDLIPKTGYPCKCATDENTNKPDCKCLNSKGKSWLYTRLTGHWKCGVHADWSQLQECVANYLDKEEGTREREYHYITMLRDPLKRYLSEWKHVARGATWEDATISCFEDKNTTSCYTGADWKGVSLKEFMECPNNNGHNRQVMMAASLKTIGCDKLRKLSKEARDQLILESAKENLRNMTFFGFTDEYPESQKLLELTFDVRLNNTLKSHLNIAAKTSDELSDSDKEAILKLNYLDQQFHQYAKELYKQRFAKLNETIS